ncbi:MAG: PDZ domain-containing protein [Anaerolineae bacterium]|nr:PDZ domain-containing protein [Anaerolineae bacterium]
MNSKQRPTLIYVLAATLAITCLLAGLCAAGGMGWWATTRLMPPPTLTLTPDAETTARHLRVFTDLWILVRDIYLYPDYNGVDWDAIGDEYRARIEVGLSDEEFWLLMNEMLRELNDDHSYFLSPDEVAEQEKLYAGDLDYVGLGLSANGRPGKGYAVVLQVLPDSPAADAGLRAHDRILSVADEPVCCDADGYDSLYRLRGPEGSTVELRVQTPGESPRTTEITRARIQGTLPIETQRLEGNIGYILVPNLWDETLFEQVHRALMDMDAEGELNGLILDMRINPGGTGDVLRGLLVFFVKGELGHFVSRDHVSLLNVKGIDVGGSQSVPLVIMVGSDTFSFAEVFSGALQEAGRARIVGRTTDGNVETLRGYDFEDGSQAWIAQETFRPPSGTDWEETGIVPDIEIPLDWDEFTAEDDAQLEAALKLLREYTSASLSR